MCSYDVVGATTWWSKDQAMVMWSSACHDGVGWRYKAKSWSSRQRYIIGIFILHPRHHGWLRILVLHMPLGNISLSICIWIECTIFALRFLTWKWAKICAKMFHMLGLAHMRIGQTRIKNKTWRSALDRAMDASLESVGRWRQRLVAYPHSRTAEEEVSDAVVLKRQTLSIASVGLDVSSSVGLGDDRRSAHLLLSWRTRHVAENRRLDLSGPCMSSVGHVDLQVIDASGDPD
jgi:hypothetical protein